MPNIGVITKRVNESGSLPFVSRTVKAAFCGISLGENDPVYNKVTQLSGSDGTIDTFTTDIVSSVLRVSPNSNDNINIYTPNIDYQFTSPNQLTWLNATVGVPELEGQYGSDGTGFSLSSIKYRIVSTGTDGETTGSNIVTLQNTGSTQSQKLYWTKVDFATGYNIYAQIDGTGDYLRVVAISNPNTVNYEFLNTPVQGVQTLPTTNSAHRRPATDSTYYVDYVKVTYDTDVHSFTSLSAVENKYGVGSEISNIAGWGFNYLGIDELYIGAVNSDSTSTTNDKYFIAIDKFSNQDVQYTGALKDSTAVSNYLVQKAKINSSDTEGKERFAVIHIPNDITELGDINTAGTIKYILNGYNNEKRALIVVPNGNQIYMDVYKNPDGTITENKLVPNYFLSVAYEMICATREDPATSTIGVQFPGFNFGADGAPWVDSVVCDQIADLGGVYIYSKNGIPTVYDDNTNDSTITENQDRPVLSGEDELRRRLRGGTNQYIGRKITAGLMNALYSTTSNIIKQAISDIIINNFTEGSLEVNQDATQKNTVNILFEYESIYTLKKLIFKYQIKI